MKAAKKQLAEEGAELDNLHERNGDLGLKVQMLEQELAEVRSQLSTQTAPQCSEFPDAADLLNQLKSKRKKSKADLGDVEAILEILEPTD